jgi:hypothetical protein
VEDTPDRWVPPAGEREREERERWSGPRELLGPEAEWAGGLTGPASLVGWLGKRRRRGLGFGFSLFFSFLFFSNPISNLFQIF